MKTQLLATAALAALSISASARADDATDVGELVVVATRTPERLDHIGQQVTVIDGAEIKARQSVVVSDLLAATPGVSFSRNGGVGGSTSLRIRGAETDQTVVVIDGVKLNDPSGTGGGYNFANLLIGDIDHIEVLRGAQSTLWGSQAIGGVVNITTAQPTEAFEGSVMLEAGSMNTGSAQVGVGGKTDRVSWRLAGGYYTTDGVSSYRFGKEDDGYHNSNLSGRMKVTLTDTAFIDLRAVWTKGRNKFDGFPAPLFAFADDPEYGTTEDLVTYAGLNFDLFDGKLKNRVAYGYTHTDRDNFNPVQPVTTRTFDAAGENKRWEYQGELALPHDWKATFGVESERSEMRTASPSNFDLDPVPLRAKVGIDSVYIQAIGEVLPNLTLTLGGRHDSHDTFGDHDLGQVALAWRLNDDKTILRASFGQGFKAPTLYQLYSQYGTANLEPEKANSWDAGVEHHFDVAKAQVSATWFQRETENQIDFVSCAATSIFPGCVKGGVRRSGFYSNVAQTNAHGVELVGQATVSEVKFEANYTWTHTENDSPGNANRGKELTRRPEHQANLQASYTWPIGLETSAAIRYVGHTFDNAANTTKLDAYTLLDVRASYPVTETIEVYGRIENATDRSYETTKNYGSPGRGAYIGVRAAF
jgi:vitamin B12 transporter